jgi:hypothetical protein
LTVVGQLPLCWSSIPATTYLNKHPAKAVQFNSATRQGNLLSTVNGDRDVWRDMAGTQQAMSYFHLLAGKPFTYLYSISLQR